MKEWAANTKRDSHNIKHIMASMFTTNNERCGSNGMGNGERSLMVKLVCIIMIRLNGQHKTHICW